ncbi:LCP family protein [Paenibacillus glycinis]|uniref:LytR family transcriptional regulator n=1 Tax=Paenibacillus glycinis TaxID=2697035 RepID=A0ABW9XLW3_9BACL|nr:LCP family protein [Paenibacillus glycinis]NBD23617.1 LytR family transcriptional regulator [Paenibacillus glycinis]
MKRWLKLSLLSITVLLIGGGAYGYYALLPSRHFSRTDIPVLVKPTQTETKSGDSASNSNRADNSDSADSANQKNAKQDKNAFNVLVLGLDARGNENSRSDVIMVVRVKPKEGKANIVSIPRDTRVYVDEIGMTKINHAHIVGELRGGTKEGTQTALQTVSNLLNVPINYYIKTDFKGFENFIDTIGGVNVHINEALFLRAISVTLQPGDQIIDGKTALGLVRERWAFSDGDFGRQTEQSQILQSVAEQLLSPKHLPELAGLLVKLKSDILDTNLKEDDLISLAWMLKGMNKDDFDYVQVPGKSGYEMDPMVGSKLYYWIPDKELLAGLSEQYLK